MRGRACMCECRRLHIIRTCAFILLTMPVFSLWFGLVSGMHNQGREGKGETSGQGVHIWMCIYLPLPPVDSPATSAARDWMDEMPGFGDLVLFFFLAKRKTTFNIIDLAAEGNEAFFLGHARIDRDIQSL